MLKDNKQKLRREFLKKSLYATPHIIALGSLVKPENAHAGGSNPAGPPGGTGFGSTSNSGGGLTGNTLTGNTLGP